MRIEETGFARIATYQAIPIGFWCRSRLDVSAMLPNEGAKFVEVPLEPYWKDYDKLSSETPGTYADNYETSHWIVLMAVDHETAFGGAIVALRTPDFEMLDGRDDLCVLIDIRVHPDHRGRGVGAALFHRAAKTAHERGCTELIVETQDTNAAACRFYRAMGCTLARVDSPGYPGFSDEDKLIWRLSLGGR